MTLSTFWNVLCRPRYISMIRYDTLCISGRVQIRGIVPFTMICFENI